MTELSSIISKCRICFQIEEREMIPFFEKHYKGKSLAEILNNVSTLKIDNCPKWPTKVCKNCSSVIISFNNLIQILKETEETFKNSSNKKEEVVFMDEEDYNNFIECETGSYVESDNEEIKPNLEYTTSELTENKQETECGDIFQNDIKDNCRIIDEMGNREIKSVKYSCESCGDSFLFKSGFCQHMVQKHNTYVMEDEYKQYSKEITIRLPPPLPENAVKVIKKTYISKRARFQCQICKTIFSAGQELKDHYHTHKNHVCEHCGAGFIKSSYLRDHLLMHSSERRYTCEICGKKFKYRNGLSVHKNIHVNFKGFICDTCGQGFNTRSTLKTHMKLKHTDERNFQCSECDLSFKVKSWLDKHFSRKHTSNRTKDYVCNMCGIAYLNKTTLTRHMSDKHTGTPVRHHCNVCDKSYTMKNKLNAHMQKKHNIILMNPVYQK
nr:zinc finger protein 99-like [Leptinotarsa decemlineata]